MRMNVSILTFHWTINYGGVLQAYALQEVLKSLNTNPEFIDYHNDNEILNNLSNLQRVRHKYWDIIARLFFRRHKRELLTDMFRKNYLNISPIKCNSIRDLIELPTRDAYIVGSDQVWNPELTSNPSVYLLSFAKSQKKISYAASFGKASIPLKYISVYQNELKKFYSISVREEDGAKLLNKIGINNVSVVLDPVLLLSKNQWCSIASKQVYKKKYILCYYMPSPDNSVTTAIKQISLQLSHLTGYSIVNIGKREYEILKFYENNKNDVGPAEFINLFMNSEIVVTNSFHGTAFSIKMNKPFYVPINLSIPDDDRLSNRIECLLNKLHCSDRIINTSEEIRIDVSSIRSLNYDDINSCLEQYIKDSISFLQNAINMDS